MDAAKVAELEEAQAAAQAALLAEMELLRRQKQAVDEQARRLEAQARLHFLKLLILSLVFRACPYMHGNFTKVHQCHGCINGVIRLVVMAIQRFGRLRLVHLPLGKVMFE